MLSKNFHFFFSFFVYHKPRLNLRLITDTLSKPYFQCLRQLAVCFSLKKRRRMSLPKKHTRRLPLTRLWLVSNTEWISESESPSLSTLNPQASQNEKATKKHKQTQTNTTLYTADAAANLKNSNWTIIPIPYPIPYRIYRTVLVQ